MSYTSLSMCLIKYCYWIEYLCYLYNDWVCIQIIVKKLIRFHFKKIGKKSIPREQPNKIRIWKLQTWFNWVCWWEIMESAVSPMPPSTGFTGIQYSILNAFPKDQKKYYNTHWDEGVWMFTAATQHLTPAVVIIKIPVKSQSLLSNQTKIKKWKLQTRFYWICSWQIMEIQHLSRPQRWFKRYSIHNIKCIGIIDPEGPEKTTLRWSRGDFLRPPHSTWHLLWL